MKAITIKQPWASLIVTGFKDIENRTWKTSFRGKVFIHAGLSSVNENGLFTYDQMNQIGGYFLDFNDLPKGAIIGSVEIVDCVINHKSIWAEKIPDCAIGGCSKCRITGYCGETGNHLIEEPFKPIYNWVLENPIIFDSPIENIKGKLSFWDVSEQLIKRATE